LNEKSERKIHYGDLGLLARNMLQRKDLNDKAKVENLWQVNVNMENN
jgi:hypothetical protein